MRVFVNPEKCCGSGQCVIDAPDVFDQDEEGFVVLLNERPSADRERAVRIAVNDCPTEAIRVVVEDNEG